MQPLTTIHTPPPITSTLTVPVAADASATRRALDELDLSDMAIRATRALGLADRVTLTPGGLRWNPGAGSGRIDVNLSAHVEPEHDDTSWLTIIARLSATDEGTRALLLDAWPLVHPLARNLMQRAVRTAKESAEDDRFAEVTLRRAARAA